MWSFFIVTIQNKHQKRIGHIMLVIGILFTFPYQHTLILSTVAIIFAPEKLSVNEYFAFLGESVLIQITSIVPAIILILLGIKLTKNSKK